MINIKNEICLDMITSDTYLTSKAENDLEKEDDKNLFEKLVAESGALNNIQIPT